MEQLQPVKQWSWPIRINHWGMMISIFILILTGFYIADPFTVYEGETVHKFLMGNVRFIHIFFGVLLTFLFIWRVYLAFFSRFRADWWDFSAFLDWKNTIKQIKFYALISKEPAEHKYPFGPVQSLAYGALMWMIFFIILTGVILMGAGYHAGLTSLIYKIVKPFECMMGGLAMVRWFHHILTWLFILFIVVHVYMASWYDVIFGQGTISSMVSGIVFKKPHE